MIADLANISAKAIVYLSLLMIGLQAWIIWVDIKVARADGKVYRHYRGRAVARTGIVLLSVPIIEILWRIPVVHFDWHLWSYVTGLVLVIIGTFDTILNLSRGEHRIISERRYQ